MNKAEFIDALAKTAEMTVKQTSDVIDAFWEQIAKTLKKGDEVSFPYGKFVLLKRAARKGRNPLTGAEIKISAKSVPTFKAGKQFKDKFVK